MVLSVLAEIESRGSGANTGALLGGVALLVLWLVVVGVQILRHRRRNASTLEATRGPVESSPATDEAPDAS